MEEELSKQAVQRHLPVHPAIHLGIGLCRSSAAKQKHPSLQIEKREARTT